MMDRALKERIIGAAILVVVVVLVVPVFLDGPPGADEVVSERVPLPGQSDQESKTVILELDRSEPVPSNGANQPAAVRPEEKTTPTPTPAPAPVQTPPEPEPSSTGMWAVQLGSFSQQENAERLAADLRKQGHAAFLSQVMTANGQNHRVRIGPQKDRAAAEAVAEQLKKAGYEGRVLPHP
jgi:DedD protein